MASSLSGNWLDKGGSAALIYNGCTSAHHGLFLLDNFGAFGKLLAGAQGLTNSNKGMIAVEYNNLRTSVITAKMKCI
jgi:hypothetical protein